MEFFELAISLHRRAATPVRLRSCAFGLRSSFTVLQQGSDAIPPKPRETQYSSPKNILIFACHVEPIYYPTPMIRKSNSWSPASTRGKGADTFGSSTPSQPGDQSVLRILRCGEPSSGGARSDLISRSRFSDSACLKPGSECSSSFSPGFRPANLGGTYRAENPNPPGSFCILHSPLSIGSAFPGVRPAPFGDTANPASVTARRLPRSILSIAALRPWRFPRNSASRSFDLQTFNFEPNSPRKPLQRPTPTA
jgi:hypothetical protein